MGVNIYLFYYFISITPVSASRKRTSLDFTTSLLGAEPRSPTRTADTPFSYQTETDMILGHLLLLVSALYSSSVLAADYDGTRIANRTIERVRRDT
jgi:hypothetical protein